MGSSVTNSYSYDGTVTFTYPAITVVPAICDNLKTFSCSVQSQQYLGSEDLCQTTIANAPYSSTTTFSSATGEHTLTSDDKDTLNPGIYTFIMTVTIGDKSEQVLYTLTLNDPCPSATLSITNDPFPLSQTYILRDPQVVMPYDPSNMVSSSVSVNCGAPVIEFYLGTNLNLFSYALFT